MNNCLYRISALIIFILIAGSYECNAQLDAERTAWNRLKDGKWERAFRLLKKSLRKDSTNLEANYVMGSWFFTATNPEFQIDSAYRYVTKAIHYYDTSTVRDKERAHKFPIDSLILNNLMSKVDSAAFVRAKLENTESGYIQFIKAFPKARQQSMAIELRDEVSFLEALKINTHQSFYAYLMRYPNSLRAMDASERYEKLLFEEKTKSKKLASFTLFLKEYPESPYANEAHRQVFEISTASGEPEDFFNYLSKYPTSTYQNMIEDILFHIYKEREEAIPHVILNDSLKHMIELNSGYWIPFLKNNVFGFMDQTGAEVLAPKFQDVRDEYKCGPVVDDILSLPDGYFSRSGKKIASQTSPIQSIGSGYLTLNNQNCLQLIHKSGRRIINDCYESFEVIDDHFIAARRNGYITLFTLSGRQLPLSDITHVEHAEGLLLLTRAGKKVVNTISQVAALADGNLFHAELVFDEVSVIDKGFLQVRNSGLEGIIDRHLSYVVPLGRHTLTKTPFGLIEKENGRISLHEFSESLANKTFDNIIYHRTWLLLSDQQKFQLFDIPSKKLIEADADSVWFDQGLTFIHKANLHRVYLSATHFIDLEPDSKIHFISSRDSVQFFYTESKKGHTVFTLNEGRQLFVTDAELIESLGTDYFIVFKGARKGVLAKNGKPVVPIEMDAIILTGKNHLSLLKDKKFGLYDLRNKKYFKPMYERNLIPLDEKNLVIYKDGLYSLMSTEGKPITEFEYSEVQPWNDSLIWVKKNFQWKLLNYYTKEIIQDRVKDFIWIFNTDTEKIARIHKENYYGVISNRKGMIVPASFTEIINLGTPNYPFYFTEKQVEEAGIFVVVYYDKDGKLVRRQAYEEEEYDRLLCEDH